MRGTSGGRHWRAGLATLLATTAIGCAPARAQTATAPNGQIDTAVPPSDAGTPATTGAAEVPEEAGLQEIVVTAQKREENLQRVPLSIQALGTAKLEALEVQDFNDFAAYLPSVSFQTLGPGAAQIYMRGVASGGDGNHSGPQPSVGLYLDEQPITTIQGPLDIHIYDVARVEALAGPQGTLYGASSEAGTIRIITNKPDPTKFSGAMDLEVNGVRHGGTGYVAEGYLNLPITERIAARVVGWYDRDAGYIDNVAAVRNYPTASAAAGVPIFRDNADLVENNFNDVDTYGGRAALRIDLDDNWTVTPTVMGQHQKSHGFFGADPKLDDLEVSRFRDEYAKDRWVQAALTVEGRIANFDVTYAGAYLKRKIDNVSDYADYSYFYDVLYNSTVYDNAGDTIDPSQYIIGRDRFTKQSHELRFTTPADLPIRAVAGLFYQRQKHNIRQVYRIDELADAISVPGSDDTIWLTQQLRVDRDYAAFGEVTGDLTEKISLLGGIRVFKYRNTLVGFNGFGAGFSSSTGQAACFGGPNGPAVVDNSPCTNLGVVDPETGEIKPRESKETGSIYKLNATYKFDGRRLAYFTFSRGFRPGGVNRRSTPSLPPYQADYLDNFELGAKTSWLDNRLRVNVALFHENWKGFQFAILGANGLTEIKNAARARIRGVEGDVNMLVADGVTLSGAFAYTDAKLSKNYCGVTDAEGTPITECDDPTAPKGQRLPVTPKFKANAVLRYDFEPMPDLKAHVQGSVVHQSDVYSDLLTLERSIYGVQDGFTYADFNAGVTVNGWSAELYVTNAFDKRAQLSRAIACAVTTCGDPDGISPGGGQIYTIPSQPRTIGLKLGRKF
jgi:iron complex outermembrane recepter protein